MKFFPHSSRNLMLKKIDCFKIKSSTTKNIWLITLLVLLSFSRVSGQTPGIIYQPAATPGNSVLDPNGDGYTSATTGGFISDDQLESEIPYSSLIFPMVEPNSDLSAGPSCSFTDFVDQGDQDPVQSYLDANGNWLFRMRMGTTAPNSKSYSILIDTDGLFGGSGPNADPQYSSSNPGFEIEIVLATNFGVYVYDVNNSNCSPVISYAGSTNYQKSLALTTSCGNPDYFYDFFVKMSDLTTQFGMTSATPVRMAIVDNMGAQKSTVCSPASASDVAGVDSTCGTLENCYTVIIDNYTPCAPGQVCPDRSLCPTINGPIATGATSVSITTTEAIGTIIKVYNGNTLIGTSAATTTSPQTLSVSVSALATGSVIYATAQAPGEGVSIGNCDAETVKAVVVSCSSLSPTFVLNNGNQITVTTNHLAGTILRLYQMVGSTPTLLASHTTTSSPESYTFTTTGNGFTGKTLYATTEAPGSGCESPPSNCTTSATPALGATPITTSTSSISGTGVSGATVYLYADGVQVGTIVASSTSWTIPVSGLVTCQSITVKQIEAGKCISESSAALKVENVANKPSIIQEPCISASLTSVKVSSSESSTASVKLYSFNGSTYAPITGTSSYASGVWTFTPDSPIAAGTTIVATIADASKCKTESVYSNAISLTTAPSINGSTTVNGPVYENSTSIFGTGINGEWIQLYVDGSIPYKNVAGTLTPIGRVQVAGGAWSVIVDQNSIYLGAVLKVTTASASTGGCESALSASSVIVQCTPPALQTYAGGSHSYCFGQAGFITLDASESGVIYELVNGAGTKVGPSAVGTGSAINLYTNALTAHLTNVYVKAYKLLNPSCSITSTVQINFDVQTPSPAITLTSTNVSVLQGATSAPFAYSNPLNSPTNYSIAFSIAAKSQGFLDVSSTALPASSINVTVPAAVAVGTYSAVLTITGAGACSSTYPISITVYTNTSPPVITTQPIAQTICSGTGTTFTIAATSSGAVNYNWQYSTDGGVNWLPSSTTYIADGGIYSNATTATLSISNVAGLNGYKYRGVATNANGSTISNPATLTVLANPAITSQPVAQVKCAGTSASFTIVQTNGTSIQWQVDNVDITDGGVYSGATTGTLSISNVTGLTGKNYRAVVTNSCSTVTSNSVLLTEQAQPASAGTNGTLTVCQGTTPSNAQLFAA
ncbi:immunoglobulin domain-containing protein, partial [Flavobacterium maritimum]|uniref:immunoglobulin domain-containing protein n=1 Tax=Flavobacterium maritimum TaxID=3149042 RepID=UPI0032B58749